MGAILCMLFSDLYPFMKAFSASDYSIHYRFTEVKWLSFRREHVCGWVRWFSFCKEEDCCRACDLESANSSSTN